MESGRKSSINKISGGTPAQKEVARATFENRFSNPDQPTKFEREKTPDEVEIIEGVISEMNNFLQGYGAQPLAISAEHIHLLDENRLSDDGRSKFLKKYPSATGFYRPATQDIWIFISRIKSPLTTAHVLAHELIHFFGFNSRIIKQGGKDYDHRLGLAVQDPKVDLGKMPGLNLFNETNEATTEGLMKRFFPRLKNIPVLREEYEKVEKAQKEHGDDIAHLNVTQSETESGTVFEAEVEMFGYRKFREADQEVFKEILKQHPDKFTSEEEVFTVFARAAMTGDVKHMASLVESLGRGAFRALARRKTPKDEKTN